MRNLVFVAMLMGCGDNLGVVTDPEAAPTAPDAGFVPVGLCPVDLITSGQTECVFEEAMNDPDVAAVCDNLPTVVDQLGVGSDPAPCLVACDREALKAFVVDGQPTVYTCESTGGPHENELYFVVARP